MVDEISRDIAACEMFACVCGIPVGVHVCILVTALHQSRYHVLTCCGVWWMALTHGPVRTCGLLCQKQVHVYRTGTSNCIPQILSDVINCPCPWYLLLAHKSSYNLALNSILSNVRIQAIHWTNVDLMSAWQTPVVFFNQNTKCVMKKCIYISCKVSTILWRLFCSTAIDYFNFTFVL